MKKTIIFLMATFMLTDTDFVQDEAYSNKHMKRQSLPLTSYIIFPVKLQQLMALFPPVFKKYMILILLQ